MSYFRVVPRDVFNEADLLKCIGKLTLLIEDQLATGWTYQHDGQAFDIQQDESDGSIFVANMSFWFNKKRVDVYRPLNSRDSWPLWTRDDERVFDHSGNLEIKMENS